MVHRAMSVSAVRLGCLPACALASACGGSERESFPSSEEPPGSATPAGQPTGPVPGFDPARPTPAPPPAPPVAVDVVYGHSATTLYKLDPKTKVVTPVGAFDCSSQVTDLAIDEASHAYATSFSAFCSLDLATAKCRSRKMISRTRCPSSRRARSIRRARRSSARWAARMSALIRRPERRSDDEHREPERRVQVERRRRFRQGRRHLPDCDRARVRRLPPPDRCEDGQRDPGLRVRGVWQRLRDCLPGRHH